MKKLQQIQAELKAPKGQNNAFGNYKYRSCEDILEAVKPLLAKYELALTLSDEMVQLGDRYYIKAKASLVDIEREDDKKPFILISTVAYAREAQIKKGMDEAQITGSASSYARKYALNGLFAIDDTKDADTMDNSSEGQKTTKTAIPVQKPSHTMIAEPQNNQIPPVAPNMQLTPEEQGSDDICQDCGAPRVVSTKGNKYCSKLCWKDK